MNDRIPLLHDQRGSVMIISLLVLLVLTAVGLGYVLQSKTETQIAGNDTRWSQSLFVAEAGIAEGLGRMSTESDTASYIGEAGTTVTPGWGKYIVQSTGDSGGDINRGALAADGLDNDLDGTVDESGESYPETVTLQSNSNAIAYPWVRVEYVLDAATGQVMRFGDHDGDVTTPQQFNLVAGAPVIRIRAQGSQGTASRQVEIEAVKPGIDLVHAAIYSEDDNFKFNGTQFLVSGVDHDPSTWGTVPGAADVPGISTTMDPANIEGALRTNQQNNVEGQGAEPSVTTAPIDIDMQEMFDKYGAQATIVSPGGTLSNITWGDLDHYEIARVDGDMHVSGTMVGGGMLLVQGDFTCTGQFTWYGLVVVLGDISFSGGGAGVHIFGSVMVQGGVTSQVVGGNADIFYSSDALNRLSNLSRYQTVSWLEL